ncbi:MAG: HDIG domain-containing protein [Anaerolineae bacterium]|nr:MAG: HDIG domain-containing protein [Anaerolineae bacterium]
MRLSVDEAYALLTQLGAPPRLIRHAELVSEAAEHLISHFSNIGLEFDAQLVRLGCILHDAGKILHPDELEIEGTQHTTAGYELLVKHQIDPQIADFCISHEHWQTDSPSLETLMVALADKLWKGKRHTELETATIQQVTTMIGQNFWTIFMKMDAIFETIADTATTRLSRSI